MGLKNKKILITAGPTWVPIDSVRVIGNIATGETGILLAKELNKLGAQVTLLLGPSPIPHSFKNIKVIFFFFFNELKNLLIKQIKKERYDLVVHSAAVADYKLKKIFQYKIKSDKKNLKLNLVPTDKIIDTFKKIDADLKLVAFKFEPKASKDKLIKEANKLIKRSKAELVVTNTVSHGEYCAYLVGQNSVSKPLFSKTRLVKSLAKKIGDMV